MHRAVSANQIELGEFDLCRILLGAGRRSPAEGECRGHDPDGLSASHGHVVGVGIGGRRATE